MTGAETEEIVVAIEIPEANAKEMQGAMVENEAQMAWEAGVIRRSSGIPSHRVPYGAEVGTFLTCAVPVHSSV